MVTEHKRLGDAPDCDLNDHEEAWPFVTVHRVATSDALQATLL
jgi:hypothetical protein